jgi:hypothetical protein
MPSLIIKAILATTTFVALISPVLAAKECYAPDRLLNGVLFHALSQPRAARRFG